LAVVLGRFAPPRLKEPEDVAAQAPESTSGVVTPLDPPWDALAADEVITRVDALIDAALTQGNPANSVARRTVLANEREIVRRLARNQDPFLWHWPQALVGLLARWSAWDSGRTD
jgi:hypothetical protein